ncbi:hypothetical protein [Streptosporangium sp. NPDC006007]|uniref:hypothetical protein n=1 Tax=Streptosporangium sp. NPDC006007 TaxID=3154575 RepID=UPI0033BCD83A
MSIRFNRPVKALATLAGGVLAASTLAPVAGAFAMSASTSNGVAHSYTHGSNIVRLVNNSWATNPGHVYNQYYRSAAPTTQRSYEVYGADGAYVDSNTGSSLIDLRACETIPAWPDNCSAWSGSH